MSRSAGCPESGCRCRSRRDAAELPLPKPTRVGPHRFLLVEAPHSIRMRPGHGRRNCRSEESVGATPQRRLLSLAPVRFGRPTGKKRTPDLQRRAGGRSRKRSFTQRLLGSPHSLSTGSTRRAIAVGNGLESGHSPYRSSSHPSRDPVHADVSRSCQRLL